MRYRVHSRTTLDGEIIILSLVVIAEIFDNDLWYRKFFREVSEKTTLSINWKIIDG